MKAYHKIETHPLCDPEAVVCGKKYRITVLTSALLRLEYSEDGVFEDRATQTVLHRRFPVPVFEQSEKEGILTLQTENLRLVYDTARPFEAGSLAIQVLGGLSAYHSRWQFGDEVHDLGGTARTLDFKDGATPLEHGLLSRFGFSVVDDSHTMALTEDGWVEPRNAGKVDLYFFGYGRQYQQCLSDFYRLCGKTPLLPRWALGNWWSRYYKYTQEEYIALMNRFAKEDIPFSVAVIDMDWHLVDIDPKYGSGWTGYTWNTKLFPDPPAFLQKLHALGMHVTLNVHPADGIRAHEQAYPDMAKAMSIDPATEEPIAFDPASPRFLEAYFEQVHHPLEAQGVDFWWIDWQQGTDSRIPGLDPLWMLNHYHFLDSARRGRRPLTFSRYAGLGSHRYPVGFSGDTIVTWETLDFQPYFTANASNAGYGWWSHDIGGHMGGIRDDELAARWVQFGVFSPIMRLHSSCNPFNAKEPWNFNPMAEKVMKEFLRLRSRLVPYLYTMNRYASREGVPLMRPLYYLEPEREEAYHVPNEYYFGTELLAIPVTCPMNRRLQAAGTKAWLPEGKWYDFFTGFAYDGRRMAVLWRSLEEMPVLARAGAILPLSGGNAPAPANPDALEIHIFPGASGQFTLWEDIGDTAEDLDDNWAATTFRLEWSAQPHFTVSAAKGNRSALPAQRK